MRLGQVENDCGKTLSAETIGFATHFIMAVFVYWCRR